MCVTFFPLFEVLESLKKGGGGPDPPRPPPGGGGAGSSPGKKDLRLGTSWTFLPIVVPYRLVCKGLRAKFFPHSTQYTQYQVLDT